MHKKIFNLSYLIGHLAKHPDLNDIIALIRIWRRSSWRAERRLQREKLARLQLHRIQLKLDNGGQDMLDHRNTLTWVVHVETVVNPVVSSIRWRR